MKRSQIILAGLLAVQIVLGAWLLWPRAAQTAVGEPLFPDLTADGIVALTIADDGGATLTMRKEAGQWLLPDADDFPAQATKIAPFLEQLVALDSGRVVARTPASHRQLYVAEDTFLRRIEFETADGARHTLYLGSSPRYDTTHVRVGGQNEVYLARGLNTWSIGPAANLWIDTLYLSVPRETVSRVTLENVHGTFVFDAAGMDENGNPNWTLQGLREDETLAVGETRLLINQALTLNMAAPLGKSERPEYGLAAPNAVVTLETNEGPLTLTLGAQDEQGLYYVAKASNSPYYVHVSRGSVSRLVDATREMLVPPPATPEPSEGAQ